MRLTRGLAAAAAGLFVLGCLGPSPTRAPRMFVLEATSQEANGTKRNVSIGVGPVSLPKRLDRPQILTRNTNHEIRLAEFDQWAEPLDRSFARTVAENLARSIPTDRVVVHPWKRASEIDWKIEVDVTRFEQEADGSVTLAARWRLVDVAERKTVHHGAVTYRESPDQATIGAMVAAMSRMVGALSDEIATTIPDPGVEATDF